MVSWTVSIGQGDSRHPNAELTRVVFRLHYRQAFGDAVVVGRVVHRAGFEVFLAITISARLRRIRARGNEIDVAFHASQPTGLQRVELDEGIVVQDRTRTLTLVCDAALIGRTVED